MHLQRKPVFDQPITEQLCEGGGGTHHERNLLIGLGLAADEEDTEAEEEEGDGQRGQDPHLQANDGAAVVRGQVADHTHYDHWRHIHT